MSEEHDAPHDTHTFLQPTDNVRVHIKRSEKNGDLVMFYIRNPDPVSFTVIAYDTKNSEPSNILLGILPPKENPSQSFHRFNTAPRALLKPLMDWLGDALKDDAVPWEYMVRVSPQDFKKFYEDEHESWKPAFDNLDEQDRHSFRTGVLNEMMLSLNDTLNEFTLTDECRAQCQSVLRTILACIKDEKPLLLTPDHIKSLLETTPPRHWSYGL